MQLCFVDYLSPSGFGMGDRGTAALGAALRGHSALEYIDLEGAYAFLLQKAFCVLIAARF